MCDTWLNCPAAVTHSACPQLVFLLPFQVLKAFEFAAPVPLGFANPLCNYSPGKDSHRHRLMPTGTRGVLPVCSVAGQVDGGGEGEPDLNLAYLNPFVTGHAVMYFQILMSFNYLRTRTVHACFG